VAFTVVTVELRDRWADPAIVGNDDSRSRWAIVLDMASSQAEIDQALSRLLIEKAKAIGVFDHPTAKGDGREDILRELIADRVGTTFGVTKAEVIDSDGRSSAEHDAVVYDQSIASCLNVMGHRRVVRIESLVMTIEIKSNLDAAAIDQTLTAIDRGLLQLRRFYQPTSALKLAETAARMPNMGNPVAAAEFDETARVFAEGLNPMSAHKDIPAVVNVVFAYKGPALNTAVEYLARPSIDIICVVGEYTVAKQGFGFNTMNPKDAVVWGLGENALGAFLYVVEGALQQYWRSRRWVSPNPYRYYQPIRPTELRT
jgi:hypothetical protein